MRTAASMSRPYFSSAVLALLASKPISRAMRSLRSCSSTAVAAARSSASPAEPCCATEYTTHEPSTRGASVSWLAPAECGLVLPCSSILHCSVAPGGAPSMFIVRSTSSVTQHDGLSP